MNNKVALVTGGTSGIGKEIVKELIEKGCKVITCYSNNEENAKILKEEINSEKPESKWPLFCKNIQKMLSNPYKIREK